jgi:hypothetical protein
LFDTRSDAPARALWDLQTILARPYGIVHTAIRPASVKQSIGLENLGESHASGRRSGKERAHGNKLTQMY